MELKSIEMQIALPKSIDVGKQVQQLHQEGQLLNDHALNQMEKELQQKRKQVMKNEQKDRVHLKRKQNDHDELNHERKKHNKQKDQEQQHPYKGNNIDFSG
ncbi:hypothetical protein MHI39_15945 [Heyndrickxia sp. FSL K6-6286]|uniref:hypothetical protein n=1 Tax=Heyndrickxia TaxID=2837504 RepID=UPI00217D4DEA|nr:hypothetical protein [Heyndrickxia oleronia]